MVHEKVSASELHMCACSGPGPSLCLMLPHVHTGKRKAPADEEKLQPQRSRMKIDNRKNREQLHKVNLQLQQALAFQLPTVGGACLTVSPETGVHEFTVDGKACEQLLTFATVQQHRDEGGILKFLNLKLPGFEDYNFHEAERHNSKRQSQYVSMMYGELLNSLVSKLQPFRLIVEQACQLLGCTLDALHHAHFIVQYSPLAIFSWHNDAADLAMSRRAVSVIVPLNDAPSAMEVWGFAVHKYSGAGRAIAFPSEARHRSVPLHETVDTREDIIKVAAQDLQAHPVKLALFFARPKK